MASAAQRRARDKWDRQHRATIAARIGAEEADSFRALASAAGATVNAAICAYVRACLTAGEIIAPAAEMASAGGREAQEQEQGGDTTGTTGTEAPEV